MSTERVMPRPDMPHREFGTWLEKKRPAPQHKKQDTYQCPECELPVSIGARTRHERMHQKANAPRSHGEALSGKCSECGRAIRREAHFCIGCEEKDPYFMEMERRLRGGK